MIPKLYLLDSWKRDFMKYEHHSDCYIWNYYICTCGLIHCLQPRIMTGEWPLELYPNFSEQWALQGRILDSNELHELAAKCKKRQDEHLYKLEHDPEYKLQMQQSAEFLKNIFDKKV